VRIFIIFKELAKKFVLSKSLKRKSVKLSDDTDNKSLQWMLYLNCALIFEEATSKKKERERRK
jgi:hypothetical protein